MKQCGTVPTKDVTLCLTHGTAAGKYAGRLLKANCAAQPKGCSACFVPQTHYEMQINRDFTLSPDFTLSRLFPRLRTHTTTNGC